MFPTASTPPRLSSTLARALLVVGVLAGLSGAPARAQEDPDSAASGERLQETLRRFPRQALHASRLGLQHPQSGEYMEWQAELPQDMQKLIAVLREDLQQRVG